MRTTLIQSFKQSNITNTKTTTLYTHNHTLLPCVHTTITRTYSADSLSGKSKSKKKSKSNAAAANRRKRGIEDSDSALKQEFKNMVYKIFTPQPYVESRNKTQLLDDILFAKAYSRYRMEEHRTLQLQNRKKLMRRWEALNALPEQLRRECMKVDTTMWPLWMRPPTNQPGRSVHEGYDQNKYQQLLQQRLEQDKQKQSQQKQ